VADVADVVDVVDVVDSRIELDCEFSTPRTLHPPTEVDEAPAVVEVRLANHAARYCSQSVN